MASPLQDRHCYACGQRFEMREDEEAHDQRVIALRGHLAVDMVAASHPEEAVPHEFGQGWIFRLACSCDPGLVVFVPGVRDRRLARAHLCRLLRVGLLDLDPEPYEG